MVKSTCIKKVVALIQQTDAPDLSRQSARIRVRCILNQFKRRAYLCGIWHSGTQAPVVHAELWIEWAADLGQWFSTKHSIPAKFKWSIYGFLVWVQKHTLMHPFVRHHWRCLTAQKPDPLVFYLIVAPVSWQMYTVFFFLPSAASQPPMRWHFIYILISRVQDREACCKNNIQIVPADRKVNRRERCLLQVHMRQRAWKHHIYPKVYEPLNVFPGQ